jgi:hypothetical protein
MSESLAQTTSATVTPKTKDHDNAQPVHTKPKRPITTPINGKALVPAIDPAQLRAEFSIKAHLHTAEGILDVALMNRKVPADKLADHYSQAATAAAPHLAAVATELAALAQSAPQALNGTFDPSMAHLTSALTKTDQVIRRSHLKSNTALRSLFTEESQLRNALGFEAIDRAIGLEVDAGALANSLVAQTTDGVPVSVLGENEDFAAGIVAELEDYFVGLGNGREETENAIERKIAKPSSLSDRFFQFAIDTTLHYATAGFYSAVRSSVAALGGDSRAAVVAFVDITKLLKPSVLGTAAPKALPGVDYDVKQLFFQTLRDGIQDRAKAFKKAFNKEKLESVDKAILRTVLETLSTQPGLKTSAAREMQLAATAQWMNLRNHIAGAGPASLPSIGLDSATGKPTWQQNFAPLADHAGTSHLSGCLEMEVILDPDYPAEFKRIENVRMIGVEPGLAAMLRGLANPAKLHELKCHKVFRIGHMVGSAKKMIAIQHANDALEVNWASETDRAMIAAVVAKRRYTHGGGDWYGADKTLPPLGEATMMAAVAAIIHQVSDVFSSKDIEI